MEVHVELKDTDWSDLAEQAEEAVAKVDGLPMGAESRLERIKWSIASAVVHDRIIEGAARTR